MFTLRQLARQPVKSLIGILLAALSVCVCCVSAGQYRAAEIVQQEIENGYTTVALPTNKYQVNDIYDMNGNLIGVTGSTTQQMDTLNAIEQIMEANPGLVRCVSDAGMISAYISSLNVLNSTGTGYAITVFEGGQTTFTQMSAPDQRPYNRAVLAARLESSEPDDSGRYSFTIEEAVSLEAGYENPAGLPLQVYMQLEAAELAALELTEGERYLLYCTEYQDTGYQERHMEDQYAKEGYTVKEYELTGEDLKNYLSAAPQDKGKKIVMIEIWDGDTFLQGWVKAYDVKKNSIGVTAKIKNFGDRYQLVHDGENWRFEYLEDGYTYYDADRQSSVMEEEAYEERYALPTIARLEGSAEAFLASEDGALWRRAIEDMQVDFHAFPLIGVDRLGYIADFARRLARITEGRDFTSEELESGAKVCILSQSLAEANGIRVGDTIPLSTYENDFNISENQISLGCKDPSAMHYSRSRGFTAEETYTVIGLYRQENEWEGNRENWYSFTPNTVFAPKTSIVGKMEYNNAGFYRTYVLSNGSVDAFDAAVTEAGYPGLFIYYDQGYSEIQESLENFHAVSGQAMRIGLLASGIIWLLWIFFFPLRQRSTVQRMLRMGARPGQALAQVMGAAAGILLPGAVCGIGLSALSWSKITAKIMQLADFDAVIPFAGRDVLLLAGVQLLAALVVTLPIGAVMSAQRSFTKRMKK